MYDLLSMLLLGFVIGLTGALAPGPTLVATINASLAGNWTTGLKISLGHIVVETVIFLLIVLGLAAVAQPYTDRDRRYRGYCPCCFRHHDDSWQPERIARRIAPAGTVTNPYMAGLLTSAANPYFWIWWLSVGSAMVIAGLEGGLVLAGVFMIGHWCADTGWYTFVSTGVSRGRTILSDHTYHRVMAACGIFLVLFGLYYHLRVFSSPAD